MIAGTTVTLICLLAALCVSGDSYPEEYDRLDMGDLLGDKEKLAKFSACLRGEGSSSCTEKAAGLKAFLLDALKTKCSKCTEPQKDHVKTAAIFFSENRPDDWKIIIHKLQLNETQAAELIKSF